MGPSDQVVEHAGWTRFVVLAEGFHLLEAVGERYCRRLCVRSNARNLRQLVGEIRIHGDFAAPHVHVSEREAVQKIWSKGVVPTQAIIPGTNLTAVRKK